MKWIFTWIAVFFASNNSAVADAPSPLDYEQMIILDAEDLAETGVRAAYERIKPALSKYVEDPRDIIEHINNDIPSYSVSAAGRTYDIYGPDLQQGAGESWGRATVALFGIVNDQLFNSSVRFYAINGGNDLGGMFLTPEDVEAANRALEQKTDWPYLPILNHPYYGQNH